MRVKAVVMMLIAVLLCLSGCVTIREINQLNFVLACAVDYDPQTEEYIITNQVQVTKPRGEIQEGPSWLLYQARGRTFFEAARNLSKQSSRRMNYTHCHVYIVGEEMAKKGIKGLVDFLQTDAETRVSQSVLLVAQGRASDLLAVNEGKESAPALAISQISEQIQRGSALAPRTTVRDFIRSLYAKPSYSVMQLIGRTAPDINAPQATDKFYIAGAGVFKDDKLIGYLTPQEARGYLWIMGELESAVLVGTTPDGKSKFSFEVNDVNSKVKPDIRQDELTVNISVNTITNISQFEEHYSIDTPETILEFQKVEAEVIEREIKAAIAKAQQLKADIFDIGDKLHKYHPEIWRQFESDWPATFADLKFVVQVKSKIIGTGRITGI